jgi:hypothetical protein
VLLGLTAGCSSSAEGPPVDRATLLEPQACQGCHPRHYAEWASSMHAYSSNDPVFLAMNKRGQRETGGQLGDFCVKCHAPVAVAEGMTKDGLNLEGLPQKYKGVTCFFCHSVADVQGTHNNPLVLAGDGVMRAQLKDPATNTFHRSAHSPFLDPDLPDASKACGSCHDIVNSKGAAIERTFTEWNGGVFSQIKGGQGCGSPCHLPTRNEPAATGGRNRDVHDHSMVGVDVALTDWPDTDKQRSGIDSLMQGAVQGTLCYDERTNRIQAILDNTGAGHMWPSGASSDRRAWAEVRAYSGGQQIYQTGVVPDGVSPETITDDPDMWLIRDCFFDESGKDVHMFWQAAKYTTNLLPVAPLLAPGQLPQPRGHMRWDLPRPDSARVIPSVPDRITMKVFIRALGSDVLDDLVKSGDLDPAVPPKVPTFEVTGGRVEWTRANVNYQYVDKGSMVSCVIPPVPSFDRTTIAAASHLTCVAPQM